MRAAKYANGESSWLLTSDIYYFLKSLQDHQLAAMNDPTGLGSRFTACSSDSTKTDALSKLDTAVNKAKAAMDYSNAGNHASAIERYKLLFGQ
ncbi:MAG: hypothetical protein DI613_17770 [Kocuria rhizophila]|nr:MAG: hypothetical protein DI635_15100 [Pseudoxanthomonas suwonensis]PZP23495.1 MAG: hypothetical protein DI613_17770 [Kocuria rhizophila]